VRRMAIYDFKSLTYAGNDACVSAYDEAYKGHTLPAVDAFSHALKIYICLT
jgi:hypothetical protein